MAERPIKVLFSEEHIRNRVKEIAHEINATYKNEELVVIGVLKGSFLFMADLVRHLTMPVRCDFLRVASYEHDENTGIVRMEFDLTQPVHDKHILLVEDIVDSGRTLHFLLEHMHTKKPKSVKVCTLLHKEMNNEVGDKLDYIGFKTPDEFVIGYGLDSEGLFRSLPYIGCFER